MNTFLSGLGCGVIGGAVRNNISQSDNQSSALLGIGGAYVAGAFISGCLARYCGGSGSTTTELVIWGTGHLLASFGATMHLSGKQDNIGGRHFVAVMGLLADLAQVIPFLGGIGLASYLL